MPHRFKCDICGAGFDKSMDLARHVRWKHRSYDNVTETDEDKSYVCDLCEKGFRTSHGLHLHKIRLHGEPKRADVKRRSAKGRKQKEEQDAAPVVSFCPCCGTNLRLFSQALAAKWRDLLRPTLQS